MAKKRPSKSSDAPAHGSAALPPWAADLRRRYESGAATQFLLHGNVHDRTVVPPGRGGSGAGAAETLGSLDDFLYRVLLGRFDVVLTYDVGHGVRVLRGQKAFDEWPTGRDRQIPRAPRGAAEALTHFLRYCANLSVLGEKELHVAVVIREAQLVVPRTQGAAGNDLAATALLLRDWTMDSMFVERPFATFLVAPNLNDLHPLVAGNPRAARIEVPLPTAGELERAFGILAARYPQALAGHDDVTAPAARLVGATLASVEGLLRDLDHRGEALDEGDLVDMKRALIERDAGGLIRFIESDRTLDDFIGADHIVEWLRQDVELWRQGETDALPMGYLLCGPVGTGKTYLVKCLAGEAGVPVVSINNFRDRWIGSTEGNLETIFRLLHALGRCFVFIDEADQTLGRRGASAGDSGLSGRIYSMVAQEMSRPENRGRIVWVLASSRPDLIEVDLKRPGRIDTRIPLFPTTDPDDAAALLRALCQRQGVNVAKKSMNARKDRLPDLLTPGAAEALAVKAYRAMKTRGHSPAKALDDCLDGYRSPVDPAVLAAQVRLALAEASDLDLVPDEILRRFGTP